MMLSLPLSLSLNQITPLRDGERSGQSTKIRDIVGLTHVCEKFQLIHSL